MQVLERSQATPQLSERQVDAWAWFLPHPHEDCQVRAHKQMSGSPCWSCFSHAMGTACQAAQP